MEDNMEKTPRFAVGTQYRPVGRDYVCTVRDIHTTRNLAGEVIMIRYASSYTFLGQEMAREDVATTVARGLLVPAHA